MIRHSLGRTGPLHVEVFPFRIVIVHLDTHRPKPYGLYSDGLPLAPPSVFQFTCDYCGFLSFLLAQSPVRT